MSCLSSLLTIIIISLSGLFISAKAGVITSHKGDVKGSYNYWLYNPGTEKSTDNDSISQKPCIIFLHGASLCGNNLDRVRRYGTIDAIEKGRELDAYVIAPQNPGGSWNPQKVMSIVDFVSDKYGNIDSNRIYVVGMSLGGYGTLDMVATYPDRIAAAMALCGGATVKDCSGLNEVPLWIVHGTADRAVKVSESDRVVASMQQHGDTSRLIYNRIPGMNHSQPARMLYLADTYDWLLSHSLDDDDRAVNETFDIGSTIRGAYQGLKSTGKRKASTTKARRSAKKSKSSKRRRARRR